MKVIAAMLALSWSCAWQHAERATMPRLPHARHGHQLAWVDGAVISFGGFARNGEAERGTRETWRLDAGASEWKRAADMARGRAFFASAVVGGAAYAIGDGVERYDARQDRWAEVTPPGRLPRSHFSATAIGERLYVLGGYGGEPALLVVDVRSGEVRAEQPPPDYEPGDHFHVMHVLDGELHVLGGIDGESFEVQSSHWVRKADGWRALGGLPVPMWTKFAAHDAFAGELRVWGEFGGWRYESKCARWTSLAKLEPWLVTPATVRVGGTLWLIGGAGVEQNDVRPLLRYDTAREQWIHAATK